MTSEWKISEDEFENKLKEKLKTVLKFAKKIEVSAVFRVNKEIELTVNIEFREYIDDYDDVEERVKNVVKVLIFPLKEYIKSYSIYTLELYEREWDYEIDVDVNEREDSIEEYLDVYDKVGNRYKYTIGIRADLTLERIAPEKVLEIIDRTILSNV